MATYFVRKNGSDAYTTVQAQNAATAWLTIDKAANEVAAGDTVVVGSGVYREQVVMDTAGTSGNQITYIADVDGSNGSGDPGLVIISAYADETSTATRASCIDADATGIFEYTTFRGFVMTGGTTAVIDAAGTGANTYEGVIIEDCTFIAGHTSTDSCIILDYNVMTGSVSPGLIVRRCVFSGGGGIAASHDGSTVATYDAGIIVESCLFVGVPEVVGSYAAINWELGTSDTYNPTMGDVTNCLFVGCYFGIECDTNTPSTSVVVRNCAFHFCRLALSGATSQTPTTIDSDYNTFGACSTPYTNTDAGANDQANTIDPGLWGGIGDYPLHRFWGWSPFRPWEPMRLQDDAYVHAVIGAADTTMAPAFDLYNETRPMNGRAGTRTDIYYFDSSDAGPTDNNSVWTNDTNIDDNDTSTETTTTTTGSTNWIRTEGTNAPASGGTISSVETRFYAGASHTTTGLQQRVHTDGQSEILRNSNVNTPADAWFAWVTLTEPSGGWTWAKVAALEATFYMNTAGTAAVAAVQIRVTSTPTGQDDVGAVEGRARPEQETTTVKTGSNAIRFEGAGFHDIVLPVTAALTTVDVYAQYDATYAGTLPQLKALNIPGVADQTDTQTGGSGSFEKLTVTFTPTSAGIARIRLQSNDTSATGECFFDDLAIS